ncbi:MAG: hypothetical protein QM661_09595 [Solimonas sp.]
MKTPTKPAPTEREELFSLNATYYVADEAAPDQLLSDAFCLSSAARGMVAILALELGHKGSSVAANPQDAGKALYGVGYLLEMADAMATVATIRWGEKEAQS